MSVIRGLWERFRHLIAELLKFGTVGGLAFVVDVGLSNLFWSLQWETISAKALAVAIAATVGFVGNRFWTFRHRGNQGLTREYLLYFLINGIGLLIALVPLAITIYVLDLDGTLAKNISGNGIGLVLGTLFRFWAYKKWVFLPPDLPPVDPHTGLPERPADTEMTDSAVPPR